MKPQSDLAVCIGRFQPFHNGHLSLLREALEQAPICIVVLGSAHQARTPKNPFTWQERAEMIRRALPDTDPSRLRYLPMRDHYNEARWVQAVHDGVAQIALELGLAAPEVALMGHFKDATSGYLRRFPAWTLRPLERQPHADATQFRDTWFAHADQPIEVTLASLSPQAPESTLDFVKAWSRLPYFKTLVLEWQKLRADQSRWACAPYPPVFVTVDAVVRCAEHVLLIQRGAYPGKGLWAVPGGFIEQRETLYQSALRELHEETGLDLMAPGLQNTLREVAVFDHPDRSLRGRTITHAHYFDLGDEAVPHVKAADDAHAARWVPLGELLSMEAQFLDDHFYMLDYFLTLIGGQLKI